MNLPTSLPPSTTTTSRPYSMADVAMRFLSLLPDLGVIVVVGMLAHSGKIESNMSLIALLAVLAGRLNPSALKLPGATHGASIVPFVLGVGAMIRRIF